MTGRWLLLGGPMLVAPAPCRSPAVPAGRWRSRRRRGAVARG